MDNGFEVEEQGSPMHDDTLGVGLMGSASSVDGYLPMRGLHSKKIMYGGVFAAFLLSLTFILACVGVGKANNNASTHQTFVDQDYGKTKKTVDALTTWSADAGSACWFTQQAPGLVDFETGDALMGEPVHEFEGHYYQVAGGNWAALTWHDAYWGALSRCYKGVAGKLVTIESQQEQDYLFNLLLSNAGHRNGDEAWIGLTDMVKEGNFVWAGNGELITTPQGDVSGKFTNWRAGEPNSFGEEDCTVMGGDGGGQWNDDSCYKHKPFFLVEFDT